MDRRDEIEFLRAALKRRAEETSVRQAAAEVGMSHGGVHNFITRDELPYGKTLAKLRAWYLRHWAEGGEGLSAHTAAYLIEQMLAAIPPDHRAAARTEVLEGLDRLYRKHGTPPPAWLHELRREAKEESSTGPAAGGDAD
jgi:hypothetical protein